MVGLSGAAKPGTRPILFASAPGPGAAGHLAARLSLKASQSGDRYANRESNANEDADLNRPRKG
ncbi:MAG TPA: hypothetical protein VJN63_05385 [Thermoplasmata archaeon]|nr:hypothetical protein [Thermoplasmata archaeon]